MVKLINTSTDKASEFTDKFIAVDNLSWVLDRMANVNVACNRELVVHLRATDIAGLRGIGGTTKLEKIGTHPVWDDVFIDRSQPYNIFSLHQAFS